MSTEFAVFFVTVPDDSVAQEIGRTLVEKKLAACCNILPGLTSIYRWKDKIETDSEVLLIIKSRTELSQKLTDCVKNLHPYEVPEIIRLPIEEGLPAYLGWINDSTR